MQKPEKTYLKYCCHTINSVSSFEDLLTQRVKCVPPDVDDKDIRVSLDIEYGYYDSQKAIINLSWTQPVTLTDEEHEKQLSRYSAYIDSLAKEAKDAVETLITAKLNKKKKS